MFILQNVETPDELEALLGKIRADIEKLGGAVDNNTRLGKRGFARPMQKQEAGQYVVVNFRVEGEQLNHLRDRLKLNESIFRVQFIRQKDDQKAPAGAGSKSHG